MKSNAYLPDSTRFKAVTEQDILDLQKMIIAMDSTYHSIAEERKAGAKGLFRKAAGAVSKKVDPKSAQCKKLVEETNAIVNALTLKLHPELNPDLTQHLDKQKSRLSQSSQTTFSKNIISHDQAHMMDQRLVKSLDDLEAAIKNIESLPMEKRTGVHVNQLELLKQQLKLCKNEQRFVSVEEQDTYRALANAYNGLLALLESIIRNETHSKRTELKDRDMDLHKFIQMLNKEPGKHHYTRMVALILQHVYDDKPRLLGIAIFDQSAHNDRAYIDGPVFEKMTGKDREEYKALYSTAAMPGVKPQ